MRLKARDIEIFKLLNRYLYLRRTFIHVLLAEPIDAGWLRHRIGDLARMGYLTEPEQQKKTANYRYTPRVFQLGLKGKEVLAEHGHKITEWNANPHEFWHQLMVSDVVASVEIA